MKSKLIIASLLIAGCCATANAQEKERYYTEKGSDNILLELVLVQCPSSMEG